ncbi:MAG: SH3 domain-containing protein [Phycisphaerales bacterium]|nr:SH3 domain-containing protein [Phycisphaerales bacterium]
MILARSNRGGLAGMAWMLAIGLCAARIAASPMPTRPQSSDPRNTSSSGVAPFVQDKPASDQAPKDDAPKGDAPKQGAPAAMPNEPAVPGASQDAASKATGSSTEKSDAGAKGPGTASAPGERRGRITGDAVYVRSGPSSDHYPVTKLNTGDAVTVLGEEGEWIAIAPPRGCFSTIPQQYVDSSDGVRGVVNGDRVNVRAGSHLTADRYQVQEKLSKGAEVSIIAKTEDGQYRIEPPAGARLYIHRQFVRAAVGDEALDAATDAKTAGTTSNPGVIIRSNALTGNTALEAATTATKPSSADAVSASATGASGIAEPAERQRLTALDQAMREEMSKPLASRNFAKLKDGFREIAASSADEFSRKYADARQAQLEYMGKLAESAASLHDIAADVAKERAAYLASQAKVASPPIEVRAGYDVEGELRVSAVYASPIGPKRYRLVDPKSQPARTIGYIELDKDLTLDMERLMGRYVGIKASRIRPAEGMVNPVPLYIASRIVVLNPTDRTETRPEDLADKPAAHASSGGS